MCVFALYDGNAVCGKRCGLLFGVISAFRLGPYRGFVRTQVCWSFVSIVAPVVGPYFGLVRVGWPSPWPIITVSFGVHIWARVESRIFGIVLSRALFCQHLDSICCAMFGSICYASCESISKCVL
jgi:hypothetical protein